MSSQALDSTGPLAASAASPVVHFQNVSMRYGDSPEVLRDIDFNLAPGSFHFLTGASGAGKSSLLKLIYLAAQPSSGRISLFGRDIGALQRKALPWVRRRIGVVFQEFRLLDHLSAFDNASLPLRVAGGRVEDYRADVVELLQWVGLGARVAALPPTLSGGEKQRLAIARAVVTKPDILLCDEPTGNVDHAMALRILRLLVELNRMGATVVIASHDEDLVARSGMPVMHLEAGRLILENADLAPRPATSAHSFSGPTEAEHPDEDAFEDEESFDDEDPDAFGPLRDPS